MKRESRCIVLGDLGMGTDWWPKCSKTSRDGCTAVTVLETIVLRHFKDYFKNDCLVSIFLEVVCASTRLSVCLEEVASRCSYECCKLKGLFSLGGTGSLRRGSTFCHYRVEEGYWGERDCHPMAS